MTTPRRDVTSHDRAPSHRKPKMPGAGELAAMIQAGESVEDIAAAFGRSPRGIRAALNDGGYTAAGESSHAAPVVEAVEVLRPFDFPSFSDRALCAEADPEAFFPDKNSEGGTAAKRICAACEVRDECLDWALDNDTRWGVLGGMSPRQRLAEKRRRAAS